VNSNDSTDLKEQENNLELEQARLERIKLELELEKVKQESSEKQEEPPKPEVNHTVSSGILFCLTFLAPIGLILLWRLKEPTFIKILLTLYSVFIFSMIMGWISFGLEPWHMIFLFTGQ